jgi:hypothetical protein
VTCRIPGSKYPLECILRFQDTPGSMPLSAFPNHCPVARSASCTACQLVCCAGSVPASVLTAAGAGTNTRNFQHELLHFMFLGQQLLQHAVVWLH